MAFLPQDALIRATLFQLFIHAQTSAKRLNTTEVTRRFSFQISPKRVELALEELDDDGLVECWINDGSYTITRKGYRTVEAELGKPTSFHSEYREFGDDWLSAQTIPIEGIPAADRIVTRADNQRVQEISLIY
jgi:predicted transcriptional regulator